jgi:hypothetical protein
MLHMDEYVRLLDYVGQFLGENIKQNSTIKRRVGVSKAILDVLLKSLEQETKKTQEAWIEKIRKRLGDDLPTGMQGKKRQPRSRLFPYRVSGDLYEDITSEVHARRINAYSFEITSFVKFNSLHALLTDKGITKGGKSDGAWVGWLEDVLHSPTRRRGHLPSIHATLQSLFSSKRLNKIIERYRKKGILLNKSR